MTAIEVKRIHVRARFVGTRIAVKASTRPGVADLAPSIERTPGNKVVMLFPFGVMVAFDMSEDEEAAYIRALAPAITGPAERPQTESYRIEIAPERPELVDAESTIFLHEASMERYQVVAHALAKSVVLAHYEERVAPVMARVELFAEQLRAGKNTIRHAEVLREIGDVLLTQARTVGRAEVAEKPDITWEDSELDRLYERLASELELRERDLALSRKLELISTASEVYLDLLHNRQGIRVEWYIVALIVVEIVLSLYQIFLAR